MKLQVTLRCLFVLITICGLAIASILCIYELWIIPRRPITWKPCVLLANVTDRHAQSAIVMVSAEWTLTGSFSDIRARVEGATLRQVVHNHHIECWRCDLTNDPTLAKQWRHMLQNIDADIPCVLVVRKDGTICSLIDSEMSTAKVLECLSLDLKK